MSYLERWWRDAPRKKQEAFAKLVRDGQLEIVSGGWVMNDEVRVKQNFVVSMGFKEYTVVSVSLPVFVIC
jgi:hypothetical protein